MRTKPQNPQRGFSLVEVVLALGIASFVLVILVALVPTGIKIAGESSDESRAINILSAVAADRKNTPLTVKSSAFQLVELTGTVATPMSGYFGIDENDKPVGQDMSRARFRIDYFVAPTRSESLKPYLIWLKVSWPALNTTSPSYVESVIAVAKP